MKSSFFRSFAAYPVIIDAQKKIVANNKAAAAALKKT